MAVPRVRGEIWRAKKLIQALEQDWSIQARNIIISKASHEASSQLVPYCAIYGGFFSLNSSLMRKFAANLKK